MEFRHVALAGGTDAKQRAAVALGFGEGAKSLGVEFDERVVLVKHGGVPGFGDEAHEALFGGCRVGARDDAEALRDAEVMAVDTECASAERGKVDKHPQVAVCSTVKRHDLHHEDAQATNPGFCQD